MFVYFFEISKKLHYNFLVNIRIRVFFVKGVRYPTLDVVVEVGCQHPQNADYCFFVDVISNYFKKQTNLNNPSSGKF